MGYTAAPKEVRKALRPMIDNALLDSRNDETLEIDLQAATEKLRSRIFSNVEVRITILGEAGSLAPYIHDLGVPHFLFQKVCDRAEYLKLDLATRSPEGLETLGDIKDECYAELLSYRLKGRRTAVTKFVGDMTLWEMREVALQYNQKKAAASKRETFAHAIVAKLEEAGADEDTTISAAIAEPVAAS